MAYSYKIINEESFEITDGQKYRAIWQGDKTKAKEVVAMLNLQDLNMRKNIKKQQLAELRFVKETLGVTINGNFTATDRDSQAKLSGAYTASQITGDSIDWKTDTGWITLTPDMLKVISIAVFNYIQACYKNEQVLSQAIDDDVDTDISQGWPEQTITTE